MKQYIKSYEQFVDESQSHLKWVERNIELLARELGNVLIPNQTLFSKELDYHAKQLFSKTDLEFYHKYRAVIIDKIEEIYPKIDIKD